MKNAEIIALYPDKLKISVQSLENFQTGEESLKIGAYLKITDRDDAALIAIIDQFAISPSETGERTYILEATPLGMIKNNQFIRGGDALAIPEKQIELAKMPDIKKIYETSYGLAQSLDFASLATNQQIRVPVDGNKFFNKHIAIVGSTGSGKSHTLTKIIQTAVQKNQSNKVRNNSHVVIFDIHSEYRTAFPNANVLDVSNLVLPYWLLSSEEIQELFPTSEYNQKVVLNEAIVSSRKKHFQGSEIERTKIHLDTPLFFDIDEVVKEVEAKNNEIIDTGEEYVSGAKKGQPKTVQGSLHGKLTNFLSRLTSKVNDQRLEFLLGEKAKAITFEETLESLLSYQKNQEANVTIIDLSGVPFEVLSITVSIISRMLFEYGYLYKKYRASHSETTINNDIPVLLVYEEAHKYVPSSDLAKYRAARQSIERIAKEGRKYGVTLLLASQRPSEISETIFSQCTNFVAMRLTNPTDQSYVKKLLPDTLGNLIDTMPSLQAGEGLLIGEAVILPSVVKIDRCDLPPSSNDIPYWEIWQEEWKELDTAAIKAEWYR